VRLYIDRFLQRVSIACYAKRCISYRKSVRLSVRLSEMTNYIEKQRKHVLYLGLLNCGFGLARALFVHSLSLSGTRCLTSFVSVNL